MKKFTEDEKVIAKNINKKYKWIAKDKFETLRAYMVKLVKKESTRMWGSSCSEIVNVSCLFGRELFKAIKWEDDEPTLIRDIYDPQILDDVERKYIKTVLRPFHKKVNYVVKYGHHLRRDGTYDNEYLLIVLHSGNFTFPDFDSGKMYTGMELSKKYTLKELGITYKEVES